MFYELTSFVDPIQYYHIKDMFYYKLLSPQIYSLLCAYVFVYDTVYFVSIWGEMCQMKWQH